MPPPSRERRAMLKVRLATKGIKRGIPRMVQKMTVARVKAAMR
jgi:hypothetical protein